MRDTTIAVPETQKAELDRLKINESESYRYVIKRLIDDYDEDIGGLEESRVREIAQTEIRNLVDSEVLE